MPKWLERKLARQAYSRGLTGRKKSAYVYGTMYKVQHRKRGGTRKRAPGSRGRHT